MKLVKIFGLVVAVHAVAFILIFVNPGCRSTMAPAPVAATPAASVADATPVSFPPPAASSAMSPDLNPATIPATPMVAFTPGSALRASPTRPGTAAAESLKPVPPVAVTPAKTYTVVKGDSLWTVAKKNGITVSELTKANNFGPNTPLKLGQKLIISGRAPTAGAAGGTAAADAGATTTYTVKAGDTLAVIARRHGTTSAALKSLNGLKSGTVHAGQVLKLPAGGKPAAAAPVAIAAPVTKPDGSVVHVIKPGETLGAIARKYKVSVGELATANNISNPAQIRPGQELVIPGFKAVGGKGAAGAATTAANAEVPAADAAPAPAAAPTAPPPVGQDLDSGLKAQPFEVPTIKIEDSTGTTQAP
jgi:LysM repeat protein